MDDPTATSRRRKPDRVSALIGMDIEEYLEADARLLRIEMEEGEYRLFKCWLLAPTREIAMALMRGERVYWGHLDFFQAERHGLRDGHRRGDGRYSVDDFNDIRR